MRGQKRASNAMNRQLGLKRKTADDGDEMSEDEPTEPGGTSSGITAEGYELHNQNKKLRSPSPINDFKIQTHRGPGAEAAPSTATNAAASAAMPLQAQPGENVTAPPGLPSIAEHDDNETKEEDKEDPASQFQVVTEASTASTYGAAKAKASAPSAPYEAGKDKTAS